ncbi:hypothetical protein L9F63_019649, partial [Diploptera punctata]
LLQTYCYCSHRLFHRHNEREQHNKIAIQHHIPPITEPEASIRKVKRIPVIRFD